MLKCHHIQSHELQLLLRAASTTVVAASASNTTNFSLVHKIMYKKDRFCSSGIFYVKLGRQSRNLLGMLQQILKKPDDIHVAK